MNTPQLEYEEACRSGDLAAHVEQLSRAELRDLHGYAVRQMAHNEKQGGIPAVVKWACMIEASHRFLETRNQKPAE